ncbi:MAG: WG repeat-containing protein [Muribaculaceae bacterium]|nr:WG repeat-containing protein [Muribaculaceae bacterium]
MRLYPKTFGAVALAVALAAAGASALEAAAPRGKKTATHRKTAVKAERIPILVNVLGGGYYDISKATMPLHDNGYPDLSALGSSRVIDSVGNPVSSFIYTGTLSFADGRMFNNTGNGFFVTLPDGSGKKKLGKEGSYLGDGLYAVGSYDSGFAIMDKDGNVMVPVAPSRYYEKAGEGLIIFCENEKYGAIDKTGAVVIAPQYDYLSTCSEGYLPAIKEEKAGVIDSKGNVVIPFVYEVNESWGDDDGDPLPMHVHAGLTAACKDGNWGVIDLKGNVVVPFDYSYAGVGSKGTIRATSLEWDKNIYFDSKGRKLREDWQLCYGDDPDADFQVFMTEGIDNIKMGYKSADGRVVIPAAYDMAMEFYGPTALVKTGGAWHLIDRTGKIVKRNVAKFTIGELAG